jgi:hypothetical protein
MSILTIYPYQLENLCWVFDDERTGVKEEAFVLGMSEMITRLVGSKGIERAERGFALGFSLEPFEGHDVELRWLRGDDSQVFWQPDGSLGQVTGNWYGGVVAGQEMEGWLCPALFLYFQSPPKRIFVKADPLPAGVEPIWQVDRNAAGTRRFATAPTDDPQIVQILQTHV